MFRLRDPSQNTRAPTSHNENIFLFSFRFPSIHCSIYSCGSLPTLLEQIAARRSNPPRTATGLGDWMSTWRAHDGTVRHSIRELVLLARHVHLHTYTHAIQIKYSGSNSSFINYLHAIETASLPSICCPVVHTAPHVQPPAHSRM